MATRDRVAARPCARRLVFEVSVTDPIAWSLVQAWLDLEAGTARCRRRPIRPYQQPPLDRETGLFTKPWCCFFLSLGQHAGLHAALVNLGGGGGGGPGSRRSATGRRSPHGDALSPEILFDSAGECIVGFVPTRVKAMPTPTATIFLPYHARSTT